MSCPAWSPGAKRTSRSWCSLASSPVMNNMPNVKKQHIKYLWCVHSPVDHQIYTFPPKDHKCISKYQQKHDNRLIKENKTLWRAQWWKWLTADFKGVSLKCIHFYVLFFKLDKYQDVFLAKCFFTVFLIVSVIIRSLCLKGPFTPISKRHLFAS